MEKLHQTAGCIIEPDRWYVFDNSSGAQIVDQPRRGFHNAHLARDWLRWQEADLSRFVVAQGRDAKGE